MRRLLEPHPCLHCSYDSKRNARWGAVTSFQCNIYHFLGGEIEVYLSPGYKNYFDQVKTKFQELLDTIVPLITEGIPSLEEVKKFLGTRFHELKPHLSTAESLDDVIVLIKKKCTITNITCLETIVDRYNNGNIRHHITAYKSAVDEICEKFKHRVLGNKNVTIVSTSLKYELIKFVIEWQQTDDLTLDDIDGLLWKAFGDMAEKILSKYGLKRKLIKITIYLLTWATCIITAVFYCSYIEFFILPYIK